MAEIIIGGKSYSGRNITVTRKRVVVDGVDLTPDSKDISIQIEGNIETLTVDECNLVTVDGNVNTLSTMSGDVQMKGDVQGNVKTMSGDVVCGKILGSVSTMSGDILHKV
jgi:hypothetical protein